MKEVVVVDGRNEDQTVNIAKASNAIVISSLARSMACQMNLAASAAQGEILLFCSTDVSS